MTRIPRCSVGAVSARGHPAPKGPPSPHALLALSKHSVSNSQMFAAKPEPRPPLQDVLCTPEQRDSLCLGGFAI